VATKICARAGDPIQLRNLKGVQLWGQQPASYPAFDATVAACRYRALQTNNVDLRCFEAEGRSPADLLIISARPAKAPGYKLVRKPSPSFVAVTSVKSHGELISEGYPVKRTSQLSVNRTDGQAPRAPPERAAEDPGRDPQVRG
jgi:hypothetical protein